MHGTTAGGADADACGGAERHRAHQPHHVGTRDHAVGHSRPIPPVTRHRPDPATVCGDDLPAGDDDRPAGSVAPPVPLR